MKFKGGEIWKAGSLLKMFNYVEEYSPCVYFEWGDHFYRCIMLMKRLIFFMMSQLSEDTVKTLYLFFRKQYWTVCCRIRKHTFIQLKMYFPSVIFRLWKWIFCVISVKCSLNWEYIWTYSFVYSLAYLALDVRVTVIFQARASS